MIQRKEKDELWKLENLTVFDVLIWGLDNEKVFARSLSPQKALEPFLGY